MQIESIRIQNLRCFADETVHLNPYTCFVGPNGAGKSTVLCALNIFFREKAHAYLSTTELSEEDFHNKNIDSPVVVTVTFGQLSDEAKEDFKEYVRLDKLVIAATAVFNKASGAAEVRQAGQRLVMQAFTNYFKAAGDKTPVADLRTIYQTIQSNFAELPNVTTGPAMAAVLRDYESKHPDQCTMTPSEDQFYGVSKGANRLARYVQWVYVPAVKDAATEQTEARDGALGKLLARTVRSKVKFDERITELRTVTQTSYEKLLAESQGALNEISASLKKRLEQWAHPDVSLKVRWQQDPTKSVRIEEPLAGILAGEGHFEGALARFGHGLQRSFLLALLQELAIGDDKNGPRLILGCEEPELYQHPPQARHLAQVLQRLSESNSQILVSTHSATFVSGDGFENVRLARRDDTTKRSHVASMTFGELATAIAAATGGPPRRPAGAMAKIHQALQTAVSEMFFARRLVLVEGFEDIAYLTAYLTLTGQWDEYRRLGCHLIPVNGKSELLQPMAIAKHLKISTYVVLDSDANKPDRNGSKAKHEKDNRAILHLAGHAGENPFPTATYWGKALAMWESDMGEVFKVDIGEAAWNAAQQHADNAYAQAGDLKKNSLHIATAVEHAWNSGLRSARLERLCKEILDPTKSI